MAVNARGPFSPVRSGALVGVVLAGGEGRRMGEGVAKPLRLLDGKPMVAHVVERLQPQVMDLVVVANDPDPAFDRLQVPVIADPPDIRRAAERDGRRLGPLAGILAGVIMPPMTLAFGWRVALAAQIPTSFALLILLEFVRRRWDIDVRPGYPLFAGALAQPLRLLRQNADVRRLTIMSFVFTGAQLCFISFMTVHLTQSAGFGLVAAGWTLAAYQGAALVSRPLLGWVADKFVRPMILLAALGFLMCLSAAVSALFSSAWPGAGIVLVCLVAGFSASGFTGLAYAEFARLGGSARTEATGLGSAAMFAGVLVLPPLFGLAATATHAFVQPYAALAVATFAASVMVWRGARR